MSLSAVRKYAFRSHIFLIYVTYYDTYEMFCTVAKHSKDAMNNPPMLRPKALLPLCNRNSISLCIFKGVVYQQILYLLYNKNMINQ